MEFLYEYGLFLAKIITAVFGILFVAGGIMNLKRSDDEDDASRIVVHKLNEKYADMAKKLSEGIRGKEAYRKYIKEEKKEAKKEKKSRKRVFVLDFVGDMRASAVVGLRNEITAILTIVKPKDEIVVRLDSPGGIVNGYGLAAAQLVRIKEKKIALTIAVDKVAASGGYLMACVADKIIASPFAIIGSIGVVAQLPNFHRLLKEKNIDYELLTAGQFKRTLTMFGENTDEGRAKMQADIDDMHVLFKDFIREYRPEVDVEIVATGEHWLGTRAHELHLVDQLITSDEYVFELSHKSDVFYVKYQKKKNIGDKFKLFSSALRQSFLGSWLQKLPF